MSKKAVRKAIGNKIALVDSYSKFKRMRNNKQRSSFCKRFPVHSSYIERINSDNNLQKK